MDHTEIVSATDLGSYADTIGSENVIPQLVSKLVTNSIADLDEYRIPYGGQINQPGWDGIVETSRGFPPYVPQGRSYWEIGVGKKPQDKATNDLKKRSETMSLEEKRVASFVFVTPRSAGRGGWSSPQQERWKQTHATSGWQRLIILDGAQLAAWLCDFPAIGKWMFERINVHAKGAGFRTPREHWDNLQQLVHTGDPPLPPDLFLTGRDDARDELRKLLRQETLQLMLSQENENDVCDFVAAFLASSDVDPKETHQSKCLFIENADTWQAMTSLRTPHILVAHPGLDLESSGEQRYLDAKKSGHSVIIPVSGSGGGNCFRLRNPSKSVIEAVLVKGNYTRERSRALAAAGTGSLAALKRHLRGVDAQPPYVTWNSATALETAVLLGRWVGNNPSDRAAIEALLGKTYGEWIDIVRPETLRQDTPLTQHDEHWKVLARREAWSALGPRLCNNDLDRFQTMALTVLGECDPKFELPSDERFYAEINGKNLKHSPALRQGIAETLALLGSWPQALSSCSSGKAESIAASVVQKLLSNANWVMWASLDHELPLLAEAAPSVFLSVVEKSLSSSTESIFRTLFDQEDGDSITGRTYMSGVLWALEALAWSPDYLTRVTVILGELAAIDPGGRYGNRPDASLVSTLIPWQPQTCATIQQRKTAVETLLREQPQVGWNVLLRLLPQKGLGFAQDNHRPEWRTLIPADRSETVLTRDYQAQVSIYADLAVATAASDTHKLQELIGRLPELPGEAYNRVLTHLGSDDVVALPEPTRLDLWDALVDLAAKHTAYADAKWAIASDFVSTIERTAEKLKPASPVLYHRRLFSDRAFDCLVPTGEWHEQAAELDKRRRDAIQEILGSGGIDNVLDFAQQIAAPQYVGSALGSIEAESVDAVVLPRYLDEPSPTWAAMVAGFVRERFHHQSWAWINVTMTETWSASQKAILLSFLPFTRDVWQRAEQVLGEDVAEYWSRVHVVVSPQEHGLEAAEKLLHYSNPRGALVCLDRLFCDKIVFPPALAVRTLNEIFGVAETWHEPSIRTVVNLFQWLQKNPDTDTDDLFKLEFVYFDLLIEHPGASPKTIGQSLATDPDFFCKLVGLVYRSDKDPPRGQPPTEQEQIIAQRAYSVLVAWESVPGTARDGSFDGAAFAEWLQEVKQKTTDSGHLEVAMSRLGETLAHAPPDPDGLWIHRSIARALNDRDAQALRDGFVRGLFNQRGIHPFSGGKQEQELSASYDEQARAVEQEGFSRLATSMRELATSYAQEADRNAKRALHDFSD